MRRGAVGPAVLAGLVTSGPDACATESFVSSAAQGWFDDTPCHRLTTSPGLQVLQCGDPSGTGTGGPGYSFPTDVDGSQDGAPATPVTIIEVTPTA